MLHILNDRKDEFHLRLFSAGIDPGCLRQHPQLRRARTGEGEGQGHDHDRLEEAQHWEQEVGQ